MEGEGLKGLPFMEIILPATGLRTMALAAVADARRLHANLARSPSARVEVEESVVADVRHRRR